MSFWSKPEELAAPESAPIDRNPFGFAFVPDWSGPSKQHTRHTHRDTLSFEAELALERAQLEEKKNARAVARGDKWCASCLADTHVTAECPLRPVKAVAVAAAPPAKAKLNPIVAVKAREAAELETARRARAADRQARMLKLLMENRGRGITSSEFETALEIPASTVQSIITALRGSGHVIIGRRRWGYSLSDAGVVAEPAAPVQSAGPTAAAVRVVRAPPPAPVMTLLEATALRAIARSSSASRWTRTSSSWR